MGQYKILEQSMTEYHRHGGLQAALSAVTLI